MDKTKLNLERLRAYDAEWEEDKHPRADSSAGSSSGGKSPLRQAAEVVSGGSEPKGYKGLSYTQTTSEADSDTPEGELHNMIVGNLGTDKPTKENVLKSIKLVTKNYEDSLVFCAEKMEAAESVGNEQAAAQWRAKKQEQLDKIRLATKIAKSL